MKLRLKILSGFLALALMLFLAGIWSIYELNTIGASAHKFLIDNYQSINAADTMIEALEREDSAVLLLTLGKWDEGRTLLNSADALFLSGFSVASNNLTIPGEKAYIDSIEQKYDTYKGLWEKPIVSTPKEGNLEWYFEGIHQAFLDVKSAVKDLRAINNDAMYETATGVKDRANRAIMPGIIAMIAALVFSLLFSFFVNYYVVNPILRITKGLRDFVEKHHPFQVEIESNDEIKELGDLVMTLSHIFGQRQL